MVDNIRKRVPTLLLFLAAFAHHVSAASVSEVFGLQRRDDGGEAKGGHSTTFIVEAVMIPILVLLSGTLAGLTLGYMSLDETQLRVLSVSGTPQQQVWAKKIEPIRKNGHLLLTTLLVGNMVVNETLPVLTDNVLGGGIQGVVVSTVLVIIFAEIIPQSLCSRYGLQIGAYMAGFTQCLIWAMFIICWPISKVLEFVLGPHHGIVYRRDELKELINIHSAMSHHGGDLQSDTVTIVGGALDFQEKKVLDAMTPIADVFMLSIDSRLDYETLAKVVRSGHSRVPVFEEKVGGNGQVTKQIIGVLLVKQCVLLDPEDATPIRDIPLNVLPTIPFDEPLHNTLDRFQQGNSHMAVVSRIPSRTESKTNQGSIYEEAKVGLTRRFLNRVGFGDSDDDDHEEEDVEGSENGHGKKRPKRSRKRSTASMMSKKSKSSNASTHTHTPSAHEAIPSPVEEKPKPPHAAKDQTPASTWMQWNKMSALEQTMPSDAILPDANAEEFLATLQRTPLGIITLEDVLEELIGEEILDEFDLKGAKALPASSYVPEEAKRAVEAANARKVKTARLGLQLGQLGGLVGGGKDKDKDKDKGKDAEKAGATEKSGVTDPLGAASGAPATGAAPAPGTPAAGSVTGTPNASTTNLRLAQGLRAIRLKATGGGATAATPSAAPASGGKRANAPSPLSVPPVNVASTDFASATTNAGEAPVSGAPAEKSPPVTATGTGPGSAPMAATSSAPPSVKPASIPLPSSPFPEAAAVKSGTGTVPATGTSSVPMPPPPTIPIPGGEVPMARGGSKGATKKRAFKSPIAGEGATPGLEKRADPMGGAAGAAKAAASQAPAQPQTEVKSTEGASTSASAPSDPPRETNLKDSDAVE